ncbi:MAG: VanZ family protein [Clostridia bacterium]|nr:VanZ family protein [Clostridia bacterium]
MSDQFNMQLLLTALLILSGVLRLLRRSLCPAQGDAAVPAGALLLGSGLFAAAFCFIIVHFAGPDLLLPAWLLLVLAGTAAQALQGLPRLDSRGRIIAAALLVLWGVAVVFVTMLTRRSGDTRVLMHLGTLRAALTGGIPAARQDVLLNLLLFLPLGILLPRADSQAQASWLNVLSTALAITCAIEGLQLLLHLGQADVTDLITNVLGALGGWLLQKIRPMRPTE